MSGWAPAAAWANRAWSLSLAGARSRFTRALQEPAASQQDLLRDILRVNASTGFGREHGFGSIATAADYRARVPIRVYDDFSDRIDAIGRGARDALTAGRVERLMPTGGSSGGVKLVPLTAGSRRAIAATVDAWIGDTFRRHPALRDGRAYWSITPPAAFRAPAGVNLPVGFDSDSRYLGGFRRRLAGAVLAVPDSTAAIADAGEFQRATLVHLLAARDLRLISVWHPSFFDALLDRLERDFDPIVRSVASRDRRRAQELESIGPVPSKLWPSLALLSCWADSAAAGPAAALAARLGQVTLQPKGLMATEGVVSIPFDGGHPLAVASTFIELVDDDGAVHGIEDAREGHDYRVVITTRGGLYRYDLGDLVRVVGFVAATPSVRVVGRADQVCDLVGEKLAEPFVAGVLTEVLPPRIRFAMMAPDPWNGRARYTLFVDGGATEPATLAGRADAALRRNPQYAWAQDAGQLLPLSVAVVPGAARRYLETCVARGQRLGDVKPVSLHRDGRWRGVFGAED